MAEKTDIEKDVINYKHKSSVYDSYTQEQVFRFARGSIRSSDNLAKIGLKAVEIDKDLYGNLRYNYPNVKESRTHARVNVLRLFKPGEMLNFIMNH